MEIPFLAVVFMLFLAVCMFYGQVMYKKKGVEAGKTITIVCGFTIILIALYINIVGPGIDKTGMIREKKFQDAQLTILARSLANSYAGTGKCLVIMSPFTRMKDENKQKLSDVIKSAFEGKVSEVRIVSLKTEEMAPEAMEESLDPIDMYEVTAEDFNVVFKKNSDCDVIIFNTSLPMETDEVNKMSIFKLIEEGGEWVRDPDYKYPSVGVLNENLYNTDHLIEEGFIKGMTVWKKKPNTGKVDVPKDPQKAFDMRYLLITPENIKMMRVTYPKMFPKD